MSDPIATAAAAAAAAADLAAATIAARAVVKSVMDEGRKAGLARAQALREHDNDERSTAVEPCRGFWLSFLETAHGIRLSTSFADAKGPDAVIAIIHQAMPLASTTRARQDLLSAMKACAFDDQPTIHALIRQASSRAEGVMHEHLSKQREPLGGDPEDALLVHFRRSTWGGAPYLFFVSLTLCMLNEHMFALVVHSQEDAMQYIERLRVSVSRLFVLKPAIIAHLLPRVSRRILTLMLTPMPGYSDYSLPDAWQPMSWKSTVQCLQQELHRRDERVAYIQSDLARHLEHDKRGVKLPHVLQTLVGSFATDTISYARPVVARVSPAVRAANAAVAVRIELERLEEHRALLAARASLKRARSEDEDEHRKRAHL